LSQPEGWLIPVGAIAVEGVRRLISPGEVASVTVMVVAAFLVARRGAGVFSSVDQAKSPIHSSLALLCPLDDQPD
jgi:gentisate 1,2-dioxygenase